MVEQMLSRENLLQALKRVEANKGSHGVDGMSVKSLRKHIDWETNGLKSLLDRYNSLWNIS